MKSLKQNIGCWLFERWRTEKVLATWLPSKYRDSWLDLCNRNETVLPSNDPDSRICSWENSSYLTVAKVFPETGASLFAHCASQFKFRLTKNAHSDYPSTVRLSVIIPFKGTQRLNQLICVLESFYAQNTKEFEIIITGENLSEILSDYPLTKNTRILESDKSYDQYCKSYYLNRGAENAVAPYLLLHDADIAVPENYVDMVSSKLEKGWDAVHPIRLLFYFDKNDTNRYINSGGVLYPKKIGEIRANFAGGSIAVRKDIYQKAGGMDESFIGWGLEDVDFYRRIKKFNFFKGRFFPAVHLWHEAKRNLKDNPNLMLLKQKHRIC